MNKIFATGALKKFMDARSRGTSSEEDLRRLMFAAAAEGRRGRKSTPQSVRSSVTPRQEKADDNRQHIVVKLDAERAKRVAEWNNALILFD